MSAAQVDAERTAVPLSGSQQDTGMVAFVDLDGVLARFVCHATAHERLVPERVARLSALVARTGCRVVVSSTWRYDPRKKVGFTASQLEAFLRARGFVGDVHDITPTHEDVTFPDEIARVRGGEILAWCAAQRVKPRAIVVLDDVGLVGPVAHHQVLVDERVGLTDADVERAVELLRQPLRGRRPWTSHGLRRVAQCVP